MVVPIDLEAVLSKILALESVKKDIEERKADGIEEDELTRLDYVITDFLEQDYQTIAADVPEIWTWLQGQLRDEFEDLTSTVNTFDLDGVFFKPEEYANKQLDDLLGDLLTILKRQQ